MADLELFRGTKVVEKPKKASEPTEAEKDDNVEEEEEVEAGDEEVEEPVLEWLTSMHEALLESSEAINDTIDTDCPSGGMSLLTLKNYLMTDYLKNMLIVMKNSLLPCLPKSYDTSTVESFNDAVDRLVELRVILERIRPVESKLKGYLDRVIKQANQKRNFNFKDVKEDEASGSNLRARPEDMVLDDDEEGEGDEDMEGSEESGEGSGDEEGKKKPRLSKGRFDKDTTAYYDPNWQESALGHPKKRQVASAERRLMMREMLARAVNEEPEEITNEEEGMGLMSAAEKRRKQAEERHRLR